MDDGKSEFWDYSLFNKHSSRNVIAGYFIGKPGNGYVNATDDGIANAVLRRLDNHFGNQAACKHVLKYSVINWSKDTYIRGSYASTQP